MPESKRYRGIIVEESLEDKEILSRFEILKQTRDAIDSDDNSDDWNLITVRGTLEDINTLQYALSPQKWYAHFWNEEELIVVFHKRVITNQQEAVEYGLSIGIPKMQLDFLRN